MYGTVERTAGLVGVMVAVAITAIQSPSQALTIYRLGGGDQPEPPEVAAGQAEFRLLSWDVHEDVGGFSEALAIEPGWIAPYFFASDVNLTPSIWALGGGLLGRSSAGFLRKEKLEAVADGDPMTSYEETRPLFHEDNIYGTPFYFDLGGSFPVRLIRFRPPGKEDSFIRHIFVAADGGEVPEGTIFNNTGRVNSDINTLAGLHIEVKTIAEIQENKSSLVEIELDGTPIRHLLIEMVAQEEIWELAEIEIYSDGFVSQASYRSDVIDLGGFSSLGWVRWSGRHDAEARVLLRSQAGDDDDPQVYWRKTFRGDEQVPYGASGNPLTKKAYGRLELGQRGAITADGANWDLWSAPYRFADSLGVTFRSSKPRRYVQLGVDFESLASDGGRLRYVEFAVSPRLVTDVVGEVGPWRVEVARLHRLVYAVLPTIEPGDLGFDGLELRLSGGRIASVEEVRLAGERIEHQLLARPGEGVAVGFERLDVNRSGELLEVEVEAEVFRHGAVLEGRAIDTALPGEMGQLIRAGEATEELDGNRISVATLVPGGQVFGSLRFSSAVFTPNGDGVNDAVQITYELLKVMAAVPVTVRVWDLGGRLVREVSAGEEGIGRHQASWDGLDEGEKLASPGLYLCEVKVASEEGVEKQVGVVSVAY